MLNYSDKMGRLKERKRKKNAELAKNHSDKIKTPKLSQRVTPQRRHR